MANQRLVVGLSASLRAILYIRRSTFRKLVLLQEFSIGKRLYSQIVCMLRIMHMRALFEARRADRKGPHPLTFIARYYNGTSPDSQIVGKLGYQNISSKWSNHEVHIDNIIAQSVPLN